MQINLKNKFQVKVTFIDNFNMRIITDPFTFAGIKKHFTLKVNGSEFSPAFKNYIRQMRGEPLMPGVRIWDGTTCLMQRDCLAIGLLQELINYCNIAGNIIILYTNSKPSIDPKITEIDENFLDGIKLRDYQVEATKRILMHGMGIIKIATGGGKCVTAHTLVAIRMKSRHKVFLPSIERCMNITRNVTMLQLYDMFEMLNKSYRFEILTDDGFKEIKRTFLVKDQNIYELKLTNGKSLKCSQDHRVLTHRGFKKVKDLESSDRIFCK